MKKTNEFIAFFPLPGQKERAEGKPSALATEIVGARSLSRAQRGIALLRSLVHSSKAGVNYTYGDGNHDHAVTDLSSGEHYGYDANGNQTQRNNVGGGNYTLGYDAENRTKPVQVARLASVTGSQPEGYCDW